jgi:hypothetical protein
MQVAANFWGKYQAGLSLPQSDPTIIFTTESSDTVREQQKFVNDTELQSRYPYHFNFLTNDLDNRPDTGSMKGSQRLFQGEKNADNILLSSIATMKFQMLARVSVGNCCSNFHILLSDFLTSGCGYAYKNDFVCMQDTDDISLMVCCGWRHECKEMKRNYFAELEAQATLNVTKVGDATLVAIAVPEGNATVAAN